MPSQIFSASFFLLTQDNICLESVLQRGLKGKQINPLKSKPKYSMNKHCELSSLIFNRVLRFPVHSWIKFFFFLN